MNRYYNKSRNGLAREDNGHSGLRKYPAFSLTGK